MYSQYPSMNNQPTVDPAVASWFHQVDKDRSGQISASELQQALALGGLSFSLAMTAQMIRLHDKNGSGTLDLMQFHTLHFFLVRVQQIFTSFDANRDGRLAPPELLSAISQAGYRLDPPVFDRVRQTFDPTRAGSCGLAEFLALAIFLESCTATFRAFDPSNSGRISLDLNQFVYSCAHTR